MITTETDRLYYLAARPRQAVDEGRMWLLDCFDDEADVEDIGSAGAIRIVQGVECWYDGGYRQFLLDSDNLLAGRD
jgi:hypothetical protein